MKLRSLFDWILPAAHRSIPVVERPASSAYRALISNVGDHDPVLTGMFGLAREQFETDNLEALKQGLTPEQRQFAAGRAAAMMDYCLTIEDLRAVRDVPPPKQ